jgi:hypothetical protein
MNREDVIRIALEVGFYDDEVNKCQLMLERFAYLVAQQEREACAILCEESPDVGHVGNKLTPDFHSYLIRKRGQA